MKIRLTDIPATGLPVTESLPATSLNQRLSDGDNHGIVFTQDVHVSLTVYRSVGGAETKGSIQSTFRQPCARCAEGKERTLSLPANYILQPRPPHLSDDDQEYQDDVGITYYDGEHIDLEDLIQESIILSLSIYWSPDDDDKGACSLCHKVFASKDLKKNKDATKTPFAELFKKAGIS